MLDFDTLFLNMLKSNIFVGYFCVRIAGSTFSFPFELASAELKEKNCFSFLLRSGESASKEKALGFNNLFSKKGKKYCVKSAEITKNR